jgi:hypothetical protein
MAALPKKGMARTTCVALYEREVREVLSNAAVEILLSRAKILSEGRRAASPTCASAFFGSTMLTIEMDALRGLVRDALDENTARRLAAMMVEDGRVIRRVRQIAAAECERLAGAPGGRVADVQVRAQGTTVFIDVDLELQ